MTYKEKTQIITQLPENNMTRILRSRYFDIYSEINTKYQQLDGCPFKYKIYWYLNGIEDFPKCKTCNAFIIKPKLVGSIKTGHLPDCCSLKCSNNNSDVKEKKKRTSIAHYGVENPFQSKENQEKQKQTCLIRYGADHPSLIEGMSEKKRLLSLERYGVESPNQLKETQEKKKATCLKKYGVECVLQTKESIDQRKQTCLKKYGVEWAAGAKEIIQRRKQTCIKKYGVDNPILIEGVQEKIYSTYKKNNTFNSSKDEIRLFEDLHIKYPDTIHHYRSIEYPFNCDFFIPSQELYIEIHFSWMHGKEPYTGNSAQLEIVEKWMQKSRELDFKNKPKRKYTGAIHVWTVSDVKKAHWAKKHNLNWLCFYNRKQFYGWFNK